MQTYANVLQRAIPGSKWVLLFTCWLRIDGSLMPFAGAPILHLDERGRILDDTRRIETVYVADTPGMLPAFSATNHLPFVLKAISAMHSRVEAEKVTPTRQQRRAYQREHKTERSPTDY